jgi:hypothetical protein
VRARLWWNFVVFIWSELFGEIFAKQNNNCKLVWFHFLAFVVFFFSKLGKMIKCFLRFLISSLMQIFIQKSPRFYIRLQYIASIIEGWLNVFVLGFCF